MKVFLVEDSGMLRTRIEAMLSEIKGAKLVGHAETAEEAVAGILAAKPDAVVLDLHLKQGTGFDVLRGVGEAVRDIAFYVLTNHPAPAYRKSAERLGARGFFDKASEFAQLRDTLARGATQT